MYEEIKLETFEQGKKEIKRALNLGLSTTFLSQHEYNKMLPDVKNAGKFYQLFKVHKKHEAPKVQHDL